MNLVDIKGIFSEENFRRELLGDDGRPPPLPLSEIKRSQCHRFPQAAHAAVRDDFHHDVVLALAYGAEGLFDDPLPLDGKRDDFHTNDFHCASFQPLRAPKLRIGTITGSAGTRLWWPN